MTSESVRIPAKGNTYIWGTGAAVAVTLVMLLIVLGVILWNGLGYFWPSQLVEVKLSDGSTLLGEISGHHVKKDGTNRVAQTQFNVRNRDVYGADFRWIADGEIKHRDTPKDAYVLERREYGGFNGRLKEVIAGGLALNSTDLFTRLEEALKAVRAGEDQVEPIRNRMDKANSALEKIRLRRQRLLYQGTATNSAEMAVLDTRKSELEKTFAEALAESNQAAGRLASTRAVFIEVGGKEKEIPVQNIVRAFRPNDMGIVSKIGLYLSRVGELLFDEPRESNTEGGIAPAIFGTVMMVILMSLFCMPFGVIAAIYLREYAKEGPVVRIVRIAVNNLAGVPSIVYGIFGLGFFIYGIGGSLDAWLFPERLPTPTFGTGGILWASLTLALLTVPVVIVATEEALSSIPKGMREGSLALGATQWQTVRRVLLPMASPGIMTGFILSMSRAAGEVAPLMITGVVKLAPALPLDGQSPFVHLERKFMHLGFHIYDVGFQSPNVEAARPMVFVTTLVLVLLVILLNITAILLRNRMRKRYTMGAF